MHVRRDIPFSNPEFEKQVTSNSFKVLVGQNDANQIDRIGKESEKRDTTNL